MQTTLRDRDAVTAFSSTFAPTLNAQILGFKGFSCLAQTPISVAWHGLGCGVAQLPNSDFSGVFSSLLQKNPS